MNKLVTVSILALTGIALCSPAPAYGAWAIFDLVHEQQPLRNEIRERLQDRANPKAPGEHLRAPQEQLPPPQLEQEPAPLSWFDSLVELLISPIR